MKKNIVLSLLGLVVGGVISYLYCKKRFEEGCYEHPCVASCNDGVVDETATVGNSRETSIVLSAAHPAHGLSVDDVLGVEAKSYPGIRRKVINIEDSNPLVELAHSPRVYNKVASKLYTGDGNKLEPRTITESEFHDSMGSNQECEDYDKITVLYFSNGFILDEYDEVIDDVDAVIGLKNLPYFGYGSSDKDALYVRNDKLKILYEVLRQNTEYNVDE
jgi:hypothetical protein